MKAALVHQHHSSDEKKSVQRMPPENAVQNHSTLHPLPSLISLETSGLSGKQTSSNDYSSLSSSSLAGADSAAAITAAAAGTSIATADSAASSAILLTSSHQAELARMERIDWGRYGTKTTIRKGEPNGVGRYDNEACFGGCKPLTSSTRAMEISTNAAAKNSHGPATFSLVIPWCCEWVSFILQEVDFKGHLKEIFLYDKCSHTASAPCPCFFMRLHTRSIHI